jgi:methionyl-tRNA formyltransferase
VSPTPVKAWALERGIDVATPQTLKLPKQKAAPEEKSDFSTAPKKTMGPHAASCQGEQEESFAARAEFFLELTNTDWDVFVVASYGKLLPKAVLDIPRHGCLNIHPSLLPKFRGPSPFLSAILADERRTGVSIMQMGEAMDTGPVVAQARIEIAPEDWPLKSEVLSHMLFIEGGNLLAEVLPLWVEGKITPEPQDELQATYTKKFKDEDAIINLQGDPHQQLLKIKAFDKNPRAHFFTKDGKRVIITDAKMVDGKLEIVRVIPEGKKETPYSDFVRV